MAWLRMWLERFPLLLVVVCGLVQCELVDIKPYYSLILEKHNDLRRNVSPQASDMREMMWDEGLARDAEKWAEYCRYQRPPEHIYDLGSNLHYQRRWVHSWHSIRANIRHGLNNWAREREYFQYGTDCGSACSYVQMIYSAAYRVGCAMNKCSQLMVGGSSERHSTLFVCFYLPKSKLIGTFPYRSGGACRECPSGTQCAEDLCVEGGGAPPEPQRFTENRPSPTVPVVPHVMSTDALTDSEKHYLTSIINDFRTKENCPALNWDPTLQKWTDWIVTCRADYPGPPHTYTNFERCADHMPVYEVVREWSREQRDTNLQLEKGCRTPYDRAQCNHFTNMMQTMVTSMACSACNCGDGTRQLVCVYDNQVERKFRGFK